MGVRSSILDLDIDGVLFGSYKGLDGEILAVLAVAFELEWGVVGTKPQVNLGSDGTGAGGLHGYLHNITVEVIESESVTGQALDALDGADLLDFPSSSFADNSCGDCVELSLGCCSDRRRSEGACGSQS